MSRTILVCLCCLLLIGINAPVQAHTINYSVENRGISVRVFYDKDEPVNYSAYEVLGPGDKIPHQKGRTDKNGFATFFPDRQGTWVVNVMGESEHGMHGATIRVQVDKDLVMGSFDKPLVAKYTKAFVGGSVLLALFGAWSLLASRRRTARGELSQVARKAE